MFILLEETSKARKGIIQTMHGNIYTPAFGPDATKGIIKGLLPHELLDLEGKYSTHEIFKYIENVDINFFNNEERFKNDETQFILSNTYHLLSYPGDKFIAENGGLHKLINWPLPILTDSGGFQVFSLIHSSHNLKGKVTDEGAIFQNPINGDYIKLTPEKAIEIQFNLGSDIFVVLDDCRHYLDKKELKRSVYRTIEWAKRCKSKFEEILQKRDLSFDTPTTHRPFLFCVVQGGIDLELRKLCAEELMKIGFDGYAFGGWAINEKEYFPYEILKYVANILPKDKPRYAMGVGNPENIKRCLEFGYDLFDCVIPSRNGRHGLVYTSSGELRITNSKYKTDDSILDEKIISKASKYSKRYIHHLFKIKDPAGGILLTIHNIKFYNYIMRTLTYDSNNKLK